MAKPVIIGLPPYEERHYPNEPDFLFAKHTRRVFKASAENFDKLCRLERNRRHGYTVLIGETKQWFPLCLVCGEEEGPTVLITAGVHACEYPGIKATLELSYELDPASLRGTVMLVPMANAASFWQRGTSMTTDTNTNLNRLFTPDLTADDWDQRQDRTDSEMLARALYDLVLTADCYIDLHSGDFNEELTPHAYYYEGAPTTAASLKMAQAVNVPYLVPSAPYHHGTVYTAAAKAGVSSVLIERGGNGLCESKDVDAFKRDIYNLLAQVGCLDATFKTYEDEQTSLVHSYFTKATHTGIWNPRLSIGDTATKGQVLGTITDPFGNTLETVLAQDDGVLLYQLTSLNIIAGELAVAYAN